MGRICCDPESNKLSRKSIVLEGSRASSGGRRAFLDIRSVQGPVSLFPGQIVAVEGRCADGETINALRIKSGVAPPRPTTPACEVMKFNTCASDASRLTSEEPFLPALPRLPLAIGAASGPGWCSSVPPRKPWKGSATRPEPVLSRWSWGCRYCPAPTARPRWRRHRRLPLGTAR